MQTLAQIIALTSADRITTLKNQVQSHDCTRKVSAKFLLAMIKAGDCQSNEVNAYAKKHLGFDIRQEIQGVYQSLKVLESIINGEMPGVDEADFDRNSWTTNQEMSKFLNADNPLFLNREDAIKAYKSEQPIKALKDLAKANKSTPKTKDETSVAINFGNVLDWLKNHVATSPVNQMESIQQALYTLMTQAQERIDSTTPTVDVEVVEPIAIEAAA